MITSLLPLSLVLLAAVAWRLVHLPLPGPAWRCRAQHALWVAVHVLIGAGAMGVAAMALQGQMHPEPVAMLLSGLCLQLTGRWRRRCDERESVDAPADQGPTHAP